MVLCHDAYALTRISFSLCTQIPRSRVTIKPNTFPVPIVAVATQHAQFAISFGRQMSHLETRRDLVSWSFFMVLCHNGFLQAHFAHILYSDSI